MSLVTTSEIRKKFIEYFVKNNHTLVPASPLIPHNDPTLMFVNSGMVQFKNVFTGVEKRDYTRAVTAQKSVRAGGKHNDLDNVGYTARHHTFFEMLGNFSFGDYFKEQAIYYAWELLTKEYGLAKEKLYVTVFHTDEEAIGYWKKISGFNDDRIIRINTNDNFWSMGDTGPCGPCSEIFYDHGESIFGGLPGTKDQDGDRYIEIWNMVFMQYEQIDKDTRKSLPKPSIDTGMGLERITAVMQGVHDNYDIDLFKELIHASEHFTSVIAEGNAKFSHRVIADHLRASSFLIADGIMPSNEGRGYVLRRIMRRAMRHAHILGAKEPLLYKLLPTLVNLMGEAYPELKRAEDFTKEVLKQEEEKFKATLDKGLKLLDEETKTLKAGDELAGDVAFKLYDTYGFPLDLTADILKSKNMSVDNKGFDSCMNEQKEKARKAWGGSGEAATNELWFNIYDQNGATEFLGYSLDEAQAEVIALIKDNQKIENAHEGDNFILVASQTPFYGESGGQMGDIGYIHGPNSTIKVLDTKKYLGIHAHICLLEKGTVSINDSIVLKIDPDYRNYLRVHHSATHILHAVLRETLGTHVTQKGSLVASDRLRFDLTHTKAISHEELIKIENKVNEIITQNSEVKTQLLSTQEAIEKGAIALFGEKYDSEVRVVSMGSINQHEIYSLELCGGTHVSRTGDIGAFKIISENAIAAGVRRIEAVCGKYTVQYAQENEAIISELCTHIKTSKSELLNKIDALFNERKELEKKIFELQQASLRLSKENIEASLEQINNHHLLFKVYNDADSKALRTIAEETIKKADNITAVFVNKSDTKVLVTIAIGSNASSKIDAVNIAKLASNILGGTGGGGKPNFAQAGGNNPENINIFKEALISELRNQ
ncbi:MAG: alaS [Rickettsiaceae bacterium]|jgi:alanyl-tRNA synthetase|nr:alaS [Rickettsiaceae bacterium]